MNATLLAALLITNATWTTDDGLTVKGAIHVVDGRVAALGPTVTAPGATIIDAKGGVVTPGLIDANTAIGLDEVTYEASTRDDDLGGSAPPIRAAFDVADAINPRSAVIPIQRVHGLTLAISRPRGGTIAGRAAAVRFDGVTLPGPVAMYARLGASPDESRAAGLGRLRAALSDAQAYQKNRRAFDRNALRALSITADDARALQPVLAGQMPLAIDVDRRADIRTALRLAERFGLRIILVGAHEAWLEAPALAAAKVPVIINDLLAQPRDFDALRSVPDAAARLHAVGVPIILSSFDTHNARTLRQVAGNAVRAGLPHQAALAAITRTPAAAFGLGERGRLAVGQAADLVVWTGDPFEPASQAVQVIIDGRPQSTAHRQRALFERYRTLP